MKYLVKDNKSFENVLENIEFYSMDKIVKIGSVDDSDLFRFTKKIVAETQDITVNANSNYFYYVNLFSATENTINQIIDLKLSWQKSNMFFGNGYMFAPDSKGIAIIGYYINVDNNNYRLVVTFRNNSSTDYIISGGLPDLLVSVDYV